MSKIYDFSGGMPVLSYVIQCNYLSEALETSYYHQFYKRWNKIISVNQMIMMRHIVNNMDFVISVHSN